LFWLIFAFRQFSRSSSRRCGNVESRVLCGFPSWEGGEEDTVPNIAAPPSERHFHSELSKFQHVSLFQPL
jgi:hypothetical protein